MKSRLISLVFIVHQTISVLTWGPLQCSDEPKCHCTKTALGTTKADCSSRNLKHTPNFSNNVSYIDLSYNKIRVFPYGEELPSVLTYLDMSHNEISKLIGNPFRFLQFLEYLDLSGNRLNYNQSVYKKDVFSNLKRLKTLNLKLNNEKDVTGISEYPSAWSQLKSLEILKIDGRKNANFDKNFKNLTRLTVLDLSGEGCNLLHLDNRSFENTLHLTHLNLSKCDITCIDKGSLISLKNLTYFNISYNRRLNFHVFVNLSHDLAMTDIKVIDVSAIHCIFGVGTILFTGDIISLQNTTLKEIHIDSNRLSIMDETLVNNLPKSLEIIYMRDNMFTFGLYILQMNYLTNVRKIYASFQRSTPTDLFPGIQHMCNDWRGPLSSRQCNQENNAQIAEDNVYQTKLDQGESGTYTNRGYNQYHGMDRRNLFFCFPLPPKLTVLDISYGSFRFSITSLTLCPDNSLEAAYLQGNNIKELIGPLNNFHKLKLLDISNNLCPNISNDFFTGLPNLEYLKASNNLIGTTLQNHQSEKLFKHLRNFKSLDLSFNRISELPQELLFNQTKLVNLNLSYNLLEYWKVSIGHLKELRYLDLSNNQITEIESSARNDFEEIWKTSKLVVNLTRNALLCNCETLNFLEWVNEHRLMFHNLEHYGCSLINSSRASFADLQAILLPHLKRDCSSYRGILLGTTSAIFFCVFVIVATIVYRFRWKLKYLYYMTKSRYFGYSTPSNTMHDQNYDYDAFVSYANEDKELIYLLTQKMEIEHNYRLCIHERDFVGGIPVADNITTAINKSRKTVAILSQKYLKSYWCMFEFNMARMESIYSREGANILFLVFYENVAARDLPLHMLDLVNSNTYLEFPRDDEEGRVVFWDKLIKAVTI